MQEVEIVEVDWDYVLILVKGKRAFLLWSMEEVRREYEYIGFFSGEVNISGLAGMDSNVLIDFRKRKNLKK